MKNENFRKAQVWVETAVYTLIGLAIIAVLLSIVTPQIEKIKDKSLIEQTASAMETLNAKVLEAEQAPQGSVRIVGFKIAKGNLNINSQDNSLIYTLENTKLELSELGEEIQEGNIKIKTEKFSSRFKITLTLSYPNIQVTYKLQETQKTLQAGSTSYKIKIENMGSQNTDEPINIDFDII